LKIFRVSMKSTCFEHFWGETREGGGSKNSRKEKRELKKKGKGGKKG